MGPRWVLEHEWWRMTAHQTKLLLAILTLGTALSASDAVGAQQSLKDRLVGTWVLVSMDDGSGSKDKPSRPRLAVSIVTTFEPDSRVTWTVKKAAPGKASSSDPQQSGSPQASYSGTYSVNEADGTVTYHIERDTFSLLHGTESKATVTIDGDRFEQLPQIQQPGPTGVVRSQWQRAN
jgi:hypothetical protein